MSNLVWWGDIWMIDCDPIIGREQGGIRPGLVLSVDKFNQGPAELVVVLPITSKGKRQPLYVRIDPPEGGLTVTSFVKIDDIRSVSTRRLGKVVDSWTRVRAETLALAAKRMGFCLGCSGDGLAGRPPVNGETVALRRSAEQLAEVLPMSVVYRFQVAGDSAAEGVLATGLVSVCPFHAALALVGCGECAERELIAKSIPVGSMNFRGLFRI